MTHLAHAATVSAKPRHGFRLALPVLFVWALLLPFVILLAPAVFITCLVLRVNPFRGVGVYWQFFSALQGVRVGVENPGASVSIRFF